MKKLLIVLTVTAALAVGLAACDTAEPADTIPEDPSATVTAEPTEALTEIPTEAPTEAPTEEPTEAPTEEETAVKVIYETVQNPIHDGGGDPWVVEREGSYYYCYSAGNGVCVAAGP